jgi:hypothetical protein
VTARSGKSSVAKIKRDECEKASIPDDCGRQDADGDCARYGFNKDLRKLYHRGRMDILLMLMNSSPVFGCRS